MRVLAYAVILILIVSSISYSQILTVTTAKDTVNPADGQLSLREAVDSANTLAGSQEIRFNPGHFHPDSGRQILLRGSLVLTDPAGAVVNGATQFVTLRHDTSLADTIRFDALVIKSGNTTIANLVFSDIRGASIVVDTGNAGPVTIGPGNKITNSENSGVLVIRSTAVTITGNQILQSGWWNWDDGVSIRDSSGAVLIENNVIGWNYGSGIGCYDSGPLTARNNYLGRNMAHGIDASGGQGHHLLEENISAGNSWDGISIAGGGENIIRKNSIGDSAAVFQVPTLASSMAAIELADLRPARSGLERPARPEPRRVDAEAARVRMAALKRLPRTKELPPRLPAPRRNSMAGATAAPGHIGNDGNGISLKGTVQTLVEDNLIYSSGYDGIFLGSYTEDEITTYYSDEILIQGNRIERSGAGQITFFEAGRVTIRNNTMMFSTYGISSGGGGEFLIEGLSPMSAARTVVQIPTFVEIIENAITLGDGGSAVYLSFIDSARIERNIIGNYYDGIQLYGLYRAVIRMNEISTVDNYAIYAIVNDSVTIQDNEIRNCYYGIYTNGPYEGTSFADVSRNSLTAISYNTFDVYGFESARITGNWFEANYYTGMEIGSLQWADIAGNTVLGSSSQGLYVYGVDSISVKGNVLRASTDDYGMYLSNVRKAWISGNTVSDGNGGASFYDLDSVWVWNNNFLTSRSTGLYLYQSDFVHVWDNDVYGHQGTGVYAEYIDSLLFEHNNVSQNMDNGLIIYYTGGSFVRNNTFLENGNSGIYMYYDTLFVIEQNFIALNENGFSLYYTSNSSRVTNNTFFRNQYGSYYSGVIQSLKAENNYWGDPSGPYDGEDTDGLGLTNNGSGDAVAESIDWDPFLTAPPYLSQSRPAISEIGPPESPRSGGMPGVLKGRQFLPGILVILGKDTVDDVQYVSSALLTFTVPPGRGGPVDVIVRNVNGKADTLRAGFRYENNTPHPFPLLSPAPGATIATSNPRFVWNRSFDPDGDNVEYILHYSTSNLFDNVIALMGIHDTSFTLAPNSLVPNTTYYWRVVASDTREGFATSAVHQFATGAVLSAEGTEALPTTFGLAQNYPNPFNPETAIRFQVPEQSVITLRIFDILGRVVATLVNEERPAGFYTTVWNGRDVAGQQVASGIYFYRIEAGSFVETKRMLLLR